MSLANDEERDPMTTNTTETPLQPTFKAGLEDVVACTSDICYIDGLEGRLVYRGYDVADLAEHSTFEEVAYLLWYGRLPQQSEYEEYLQGFTRSTDLPHETMMILRLFPDVATPMEVLRTAVSSLGHWDPDSGNTDIDACLRKAQRITERLPILVSAHNRLRNRLEPIPPKQVQSIAFTFLYTLLGEEPSPEMERAFDCALILHADHELNASTFAARVTAATMSDIYSSITSALGTLKGPLHGGANESVMNMLQEIGEPERAEAWVTNALANKVKIPGFGHRVYRTEDPRATVLRRYAEKLSAQAGCTKYFEISEVIESVMRANTKVYPNVDFYSATMYHAMGIPTELFTPIFAISRVVGWTAHILEQWSANRLIRPRAEYTGPLGLRYTAMDKR